MFQIHIVAVAFAIYSPYGASMAFVWLHFVLWALHLFFSLKKKNNKGKFITFAGTALFNIMLIISGLAEIKPNIGY
jgi:hypothetical protein